MQSLEMAAAVFASGNAGATSSSSDERPLPEEMQRLSALATADQAHRVWGRTKSQIGTAGAMTRRAQMKGQTKEMPGPWVLPRPSDKAQGKMPIRPSPAELQDADTLTQIVL